MNLKYHCLSIKVLFISFWEKESLHTDKLHRFAHNMLSSVTNQKKYRVSCNCFWLQKLKVFFPTAVTVSFSLKRIPKQFLTGILLCLPCHLGLHLKKCRMKKLPKFVLIWRNECSKNIYIEQNMWLQPHLLCYHTSVLFPIFVLIWNEFYSRISL